MTYRVRNIVIAVVLAIIAALLTSIYVTNYKHRVDNAQASVHVLVASHDIPAGTSGADLVKQGLLSSASVPRHDVVPGAITSPDQIRSLVATQATYAGEQVSVRRFGPLSQTGVRGQITGSQRAVSVQGDPNQLLAGTLQTGDHVDVVSNLRYPEDGQRHVSRIVLRDLLVLKAPDASSTTQKLGTPSVSVLLRVTTTQAQKLFFAVNNGDWTLALRPAAHAVDRQDGAETAWTMLTDGLPGSAAAKAAQLSGGQP